MSDKVKAVLEILTDTSIEDLKAHRDAFKTQALERLSEDVEEGSERDNENIAFAEIVDEAIQKIDAELSARSDRAEKRASLKASFAAVEDGEDLETETEEAPKEDAEAEEKEVTEEVTEDSKADTDDGDDKTEEVDVATALTDDDVVKQIVESVEGSVLEKLTSKFNIVKTDVADHSEEAIVDTVAEAPVVGNDGKPLTQAALRDQISYALKSKNKGTTGDMIRIGTVATTTDDALELSNDDGFVNMKKILESQGTYAEDATALTAAACCPTPDIVRDKSSFCDPNTGVFRLPKVQTNRNTIRYEIPSAACGLNVPVFDWEQECDPAVTVAADRNKPCVQIPCGESFRQLYVPAFGWCFEYENETAKFNPEWLEYYLGEVRCKYEHVKSTRLLDHVWTHPIFGNVANQETCPAPGAGLLPDLLAILAIKAKIIRRAVANNNLRLEALVPAWLQDAAFEDSLRRGTPGGIGEIFSRLNINPTYVETGNRYETDADDPAAIPVAGGSVPAPNTALDETSLPVVAAPTGALQPVDLTACRFPTDAEIILTVPGAFREVDAGDLDFGLWRDTDLNAVNKVRVAFEQWSMVEYFAPDCGALKLTISGLCANGAISERVPAGTLCP